ncbi:ATP-dependent nuclease, partial [Pseudomonas syringae]|uniref:ATP-dependent nuclease n=1 Tax=Pseudomonas syringae TaxID=317 RepID=UPI000EFF1053
NIIFLFGKNNIGKSSILRAYEYFASPNKQALITDFHHQDPKDSPIIIEAVYVKDPTDDENFNSKGLNKWVSEVTGEVRFRKTWVSPNTAASKETFDPVQGEYVAGGFGGLEQILTSATPSIIFIEAMPNIKDLTEWLEKEIKNKLLKTLKDSHEAEYSAAINAIQALQQKVEGDDYLGRICAGANENFAKTFPELELKIVTNPYKETDLTKAIEKDFSIFIGDKPSSRPVTVTEEIAVLADALDTLEKLKEDQVEVTDAEVEAEPAYRGRQFDQHGHGLIRQAIINLLGIFKETKADGKHIILFEEPELYLHPSNKRRFREALYDLAGQNSYQILCVSHDPQLIDLAKPHTSLARFVKHKDGTTSIHQAGHGLFDSDEDTKNQVQMLNRFDPHVCESFFADEVVMVEGDTEAIVVRDILDRCFNKSEVFVLNTGSKNNMPFFIKILSHFKICQHVIHDSDERYLYTNGVLSLNNDQTPRKNSAWSLNTSIWNELVEARASGCTAVRYVSIRNFEDTHGYVYDRSLGKPLSAFNYVRSIDVEDKKIPIVKFVHCIAGAGSLEEEHTPEFLDSNVKEPF